MERSKEVRRLEKIENNQETIILPILQNIGKPEEACTTGRKTVVSRIEDNNSNSPTVTQEIAREIKVAIEAVNEKLMEGAKQKTVDKISKSIDKLDKEVKIAANA